jgi:hypothetical protein
MRTKLNEEEVGQIVEETRSLKKSLKNLSKNQLILLLMQQVNIAVEMQNLNKVLVEKLRAHEAKPVEEAPQ